MDCYIVQRIKQANENNDGQMLRMGSFAPLHLSLFLFVKCLPFNCFARTDSLCTEVMLSRIDSLVGVDLAWSRNNGPWTIKLNNGLTDIESCTIILWDILLCRSV